VSVNPTTLTIVSGQSGTATFTVTPENGFNSSVSFACSGLPSEAACTFSPSSVTPSGQPVTTKLTVTTTAPGSAALIPRPFFQRPIYAILLPVLAMVFGFTARRKRTLGGAKLLSLLLLVGAMGLAACSSGSNTVKNPGTPVGTSMVSVSASAGAAINHAATLTITITR